MKTSIFALVKELDNFSYSIENQGQLTALWATLIESTHKWLKAVTKDWIKTCSISCTTMPLVDSNAG